MSNPRTSMEERLSKHPHLRARMETILDMVDGVGNGPDTANAVEERAIVELRKLGQEVLKDWAEKKIERETAAYREDHTRAHVHKKK